MNNCFIFKTNLNDIFTSDEIKNSESSCDYCIKRRRICKCDTIRKELGSDKIKELVELETLQQSYDEICEKVEERYADVMSRFEYDKDLVRYVKKCKINDEIESEEWFYFYELLKDRNILERFIEVNKKGDNGPKQEKRFILNSFHFDEEANFLSCLNYYIKTNASLPIEHNWMGMSENPFTEYALTNLNVHDMNRRVPSETGDSSVSQTKAQQREKTRCIKTVENISENVGTRETAEYVSIEEKQIKNKRKIYFSLYYNIYIQDNGKWISGIDNSGNILLHPENIDCVWNKTVREGNRVKLFHLITADSIKNSASNFYYKMEKKNKRNSSINPSASVKLREGTDSCNDNKYCDNVNKHTNNNLCIEPFVLDEILCLSHIICGLGMLNVGGFFIIKTKIFFDNLFLSIFSILSICFKKLEIYRPSCCYTKNIVFLIGTEFNGISSIFLSALTRWIKAAQWEMLLLLDEGSQNNKNNNSPKIQRYYTSRSIIPQKWIRNIFFQEYKNCIKYFIDYLIYHVKNCISISNINLNRTKIENTKHYYISQFFEKNKIVDLDRKDKLLQNMLDIYQDKAMVNNSYLVEIGDSSLLNPKEESVFAVASADSDTSSYDGTAYNPQKSADIKTKFLKMRNIEAFFSNVVEAAPVDSKMNWKRYTTEVAQLLKMMQCKKEKRKRNVPIAPGCLPTDEMKCKGEEDYFQIDSSILQNRVFTFLKKNSAYLKQEEHFANLLQHQRYFSSKSWFRSVLSKNISNFEKSFYLKQTIFLDVLKCRNYLYHKKMHIYINSMKQLLKKYQPLHISYIKHEFDIHNIGLLFVLQNCLNVNIFSNSENFKDFVVISNEKHVYRFLSKFETGNHVTLSPDNESVQEQESVVPSIPMSLDNPSVTASASPKVNTYGSSSMETENNDDKVVCANVQELYDKGKTYKCFSEILINRLKQKNVSSFIYIDINECFPNYVHVLQKELRGKIFFIASLIIAFNYLKKNGMLVLRLSSVLTYFSSGLIYLLLCAFETVQFFLPPSCDDIELDFYVACNNFNANFIYRHYVQYIWDYIICNRFLDNKRSGSTMDGNKEKKKIEKIRGDVYLSVPFPFIMNKSFVKFLKRFNSFYFKHHINVCFNFLKQPKIFHENKILGKYVLAHFFKAFVIKHKSFRNVHKSLSLSGAAAEAEELDDVDTVEEMATAYESSSEQDNVDCDEDEDEELKIHHTQEEIEKKEKNRNEDDRVVGCAFNNENAFKHNDKLIDQRKRKFESSSSESNYSISYEFENVPSEISVADSAWQSD